ncbi:MAG: hypothetical protein GY928_03810, partial [Colwellia sp.]|nr:hypothetical protein [Colwellia sp.]
MRKEWTFLSERQEALLEKGIDSIIFTEFHNYNKFFDQFYKPLDEWKDQQWQMPMLFKDHPFMLLLGESWSLMRKSNDNDKHEMDCSDNDNENDSHNHNHNHSDNDNVNDKREMDCSDNDNENGNENDNHNDNHNENDNGGDNDNHNEHKQSVLQDYQWQYTKHAGVLHAHKVFDPLNKALKDVPCIIPIVDKEFVTRFTKMNVKCKKKTIAQCVTKCQPPGYKQSVIECITQFSEHRGALIMNKILAYYRNKGPISVPNSKKPLQLKRGKVTTFNIMHQYTRLQLVSTLMRGTDIYCFIPPYAECSTLDSYTKPCVCDNCEYTLTQFAAMLGETQKEYCALHGIPVSGTKDFRLARMKEHYSSKHNIVSANVKFMSGIFKTISNKRLNTNHNRKQKRQRKKHKPKCQPKCKPKRQFKKHKPKCKPTRQLKKHKPKPKAKRQLKKHKQKRKPKHKRICKCKLQLEAIHTSDLKKEYRGKVVCDKCETAIKSRYVYHCDGSDHSDGYDVCEICIGDSDSDTTKRIYKCKCKLQLQEMRTSQLAKEYGGKVVCDK